MLLRSAAHLEHKAAAAGAQAALRHKAYIARYKPRLCEHPPFGRRAQAVIYMKRREPGGIGWPVRRPVRQHHSALLEAVACIIFHRYGNHGKIFGRKAIALHAAHGFRSGRAQQKLNARPPIARHGDRNCLRQNVQLHIRVQKFLARRYHAAQRALFTHNPSLLRKSADRMVCAFLLSQKPPVMGFSSDTPVPSPLHSPVR